MPSQLSDAAIAMLSKFAGVRAIRAPVTPVDPIAENWSLPETDTLVRLEPTDVAPVFVRLRIIEETANDVNVTAALADEGAWVQRGPDGALAITVPVSAASVAMKDAEGNDVELSDDERRQLAARQAVAVAAYPVIRDALIGMQRVEE